MSFQHKYSAWAAQFPVLLRLPLQALGKVLEVMLKVFFRTMPYSAIFLGIVCAFFFWFFVLIAGSLIVLRLVWYLIRGHTRANVYGSTSSLGSDAKSE